MHGLSRGLAGRVESLPRQVLLHEAVLAQHSPVHAAAPRRHPGFSFESAIVDVRPRRVVEFLGSGLVATDLLSRKQEESNNSI